MTPNDGNEKMNKVNSEPLFTLKRLKKLNVTYTPQSIDPGDSMVGTDISAPGSETSGLGTENSGIKEVQTNLSSGHIELDISEIRNFSLHSNGIGNVYIGDMTYYSTTLDIITLYLKGQKLLYIESKTYCEMCLYLLMLPAIFISASCTVLSVALKEYSFGSILVSALTGANSFILGIVTYLKLDAKSESHKTTSYQFDKLQTICEFYSGKTLMIQDEKMKENIKQFIETIEKKVSEIKDVNQFPIPEKIRYRYAKMYGFNIFSEMKKYKTIRNKNIQRLINIEVLLKDSSRTEYKPDPAKTTDSKVEFESRPIFGFNKKSKEPEIHEKSIHEMTNSQLLMEKEKLLNGIIEYRNFSQEMNSIYETEIGNHISNNRSKCFFCCSCPYYCLKT